MAKTKYEVASKLAANVADVLVDNEGKSQDTRILVAASDERSRPARRPSAVEQQAEEWPRLTWHRAGQAAHAQALATLGILMVLLDVDETLKTWMHTR